MGLPAPVLLVEAATFTCGCMLLRRPWPDPDRVGLILAFVAAVLALILVLALSPEPIALDPEALDPAGLWLIDS